MPKNVLVIDDDSAVAESTTLWLKGSGYDTSIASDGRSGLEAVQNTPPDLIILDIDMPELTALKSTAGSRRASNLQRFPSYSNPATASLRPGGKRSRPGASHSSPSHSKGPISSPRFDWG